MKKLLITGFDPFDGKHANPSWMAVETLPDQIGEYALCKLRLPTVYEKAPKIVMDVAEAFQPDVILCVGLAVGRDAVTPERIAVNIRDTRSPDNEGNHPQGDLIAPDGPAAYFSTLPVTEMAHAIRTAGIPASVSNTAGTFVCNDTFYSLLHRFAQTPVRVGFIHIPSLPGQGAPSLPLSDTVAALTAAINAL